MPRADGTFVGISLGGRAAEAWERIFSQPEPEPWRCAWEHKNGPDPQRCKQQCASCRKTASQSE